MLTLNKRGLGALVALTALVVSSAAFAADSNVGGMKVVRDAETGQLRAPTQAEAQAMHTAEMKQLQASGKAKMGMLSGTTPRAERRANGTVMKELTEDSMTYSVITRKADGSLGMQCVTGADAASKAVNSPTISSEHNHDK